MGERTTFSFRTLVLQFRNYIGFLRRKWLLLAASVVVGVIVAAVFRSIQKPSYEAATTFILEEKSAGGGGLAGLASQFGFDVGSLTGGSGNLFAGDNIIDILKSKRIVYKVLLNNAGSGNGSQGKLIDHFLLAMGWKEKWKENSALSNLNFQQVSNASQLTPIQDSVLSLSHEYIVNKVLVAERKNKKGSIVSVKSLFIEPIFAKIFSEQVVLEATKFYLDVKTGISQQNILQMQRRSDSLLYLLNRKSYAVAASQPLDINPGFKSAAVPLEIGNRDKMVLSTLYAEVTKNLEASKLLLSQQTPVIQILDKPGGALRDKRLSFAVLLLLCSIGSVLIALLYLMGRFIYIQEA